MRKKEFKKLLRIETTTSYDAIDTSNVFLKPDPVLKSLNKNRTLRGLKPLWRPNRIRIDFKDRSRSNKMYYLVYRILRITYVSVWFYFWPFIMIGIWYATSVSG